MGLFQKPDIQFSKTPSSYIMNEKRVICPHCGNDRFFQLPNILLNTPGITFFGFDWANKTASVLICDSCSRMEWYLRTPNQLD